MLSLTHECIHTSTHTVIDYHSVFTNLGSQGHLAIPSLPSVHQYLEGQAVPVIHTHTHTQTQKYKDTVTRGTREVMTEYKYVNKSSSKNLLVFNLQSDRVFAALKQH